MKEIFHVTIVMNFIDTCELILNIIIIKIESHSMVLFQFQYSNNYKVEIFFLEVRDIGSLQMDQFVS